MLSWLVACRLAPLILVSWVVLRLMLAAVRLVFVVGGLLAGAGAGISGDAAAQIT
ncbi:hypothetical protein BSPWISOXPB_7080 [uncultured Gammaproteobacteria bacterium]|nr:hypothetical protein BSPWISOXPB_7080 [uncultured Gammaproteobacteria bacterium]